MRLKKVYKPFSRDLGESWMEFLDDYPQMCEDYGLSGPQKHEYLYNSLRKDTK